MSLWLVNMSSQNVVYCALFTYFEFISIVPKGFPMGIWYCVECDDARWNMVLDWGGVEWDFEASEFQYEICEKIRLKNSISSLKLVVCGEIWFHSFYNFLPFFSFFFFCFVDLFPLETFTWHFSFFTIFFLCLAAGLSTVLYYKYSSNVWCCHVSNILPTRTFCQC